MDDDLRDLASALGVRGGGTGMNHRHLQHDEFTSAAIDDVIANGGRAAWERLRREVLRDPLVREKVLRVCAANASDSSAQRHRFWLYYAGQKTPS
jgi:hypothetical protein